MKTTEEIRIHVEHDPTLWDQTAAATALAHELFPEGYNITTGIGGWEGQTSPSITIAHYRQHHPTLDMRQGLTIDQHAALVEWLRTNRQDAAYVVSIKSGHVLTDIVEA